jgi:hypothetical protein
VDGSLIVSTVTVRRLFLVACLCAALLSGLACRGEEKKSAGTTPRLTPKEAKDIAGVKAAVRRLASAAEILLRLPESKPGGSAHSRAARVRTLFY